MSLSTSSCFFGCHSGGDAAGGWGAESEGQGIFSPVPQIRSRGDGDEQFFLALERVVEGTPGDLGLLHDLSDGGIVINP